jgi:hypothetical protein
MNVYQMYVEFGRAPGFWLRRTTWGNTCAKVVSVGELVGPAPYFGNPEVRADIFDLTTGALREKDARVSVPGTYKTWRWIQPPSWSGETAFDPKAGRVVLDVPFELNKKVAARGARWSDLLEAWWIAEGDEAGLKKILDLGVRVAE